jgi:hypothetical protein
MNYNGKAVFKVIKCATLLNVSLITGKRDSGKQAAFAPLPPNVRFFIVLSLAMIMTVNGSR